MFSVLVATLGILGRHFISEISFVVRTNSSNVNVKEGFFFVLKIGGT